MSHRQPPSQPPASATQIIHRPDGGARRQITPYRLTGGPDSVNMRVALSRFRIGSHPGNDLVLNDPSVSRFHLEIEARGDGYFVQDLESTNGSWIGNIRVQAAFLPDQAALRLGQVQLGFSLTDELADLPISEECSFHGVIGRSLVMRELYDTLGRAGPTHATVLLEGESGTGKELVAAAIHQVSHRATAPFVVLDCAAIPSALMESELFGHERGAFTGATSRQDGRFREADGGTLFLDEIGELPLEMQPKLLRVMESRQVRRLGATSIDQVDVRLVAATNRDLAREVNRGTFREDLFYRLAVVQLKLPALRERAEDLRLLATHFIHQTMSNEPHRAQQILDGISESNWRKMEQLPWPGNVRELRNFIVRTLILSGGPIQTEHIPAPAQPPPGPGLALDLDRHFSELKAEVVHDFERAYLLGQLSRHDHNISHAARASGLDRMNFKRLLRKHKD